MAPNSTRILSLGCCLKPFTEEQFTIPRRGHGYLLMMRNLLQLLQIGSRYATHPRRQEFLSSLTSAEERVLFLLEEWWDGLIQEDLLMKVTKGVLFAYAIYEIQMYDGKIEDLGLEQFLVEDFDKVLYEEVRVQALETKSGVYYNALAWRFRKERDDGKQMVDDPMLRDRTVYHRLLFDLAKGELLFQSDCSEELRSSMRSSAGIVASCQRVANECMEKGMDRVRPAEELGVEGIPVTLGGVDLMVAIDGATLRDPRVKRPLAKSYWNPGASIDRCPWLAPPNEDDEQDFGDLPPFYLWHINEKRTVKVFEMAVMPRYAVISHTWGRWRIPGVNKHIGGVPWAVPANSRFEVETLPKMLEDAGFVEEYAWIDLFCIPQDREDRAQQAICRMELSRQASIFQHAETAVAWLFDIEDWRTTSAALSYLAIDYHNSCTSDDTDLKPLYDLINEASAEQAGEPCGFVDKVSTEEHEVIGWFSSLWTLQEALMRPDILLLNRDWEPLTVWDVTITLDTMASLVIARNFSFKEVYKTSTERLEISRNHTESLPVGAREIKALFSLTGMVQLSRPSQLSALILGGKRVCKHSRSQAIMSVVGATKWFTENDSQQVSQGESSDNMIFGLYEPEFINEVCELTGGSFFLCRNESTTVTKPDGPSDHDNENLHFRSISLVSGSMLPFSPGSAGRFVSFPGNDREFVDHPSVAGWKIGVGTDIFTGGRGGDVLLPTVAILSANCEWESNPIDSLNAAFDALSTKASPAVNTNVMTNKVSPRTRPVKSTIQGNPPPGYDHTKCIEVGNTDLDQWVSKFEDDTFAVCVMSTKTEVHGVLLQRVGPGHGPLVKIGIFEVEDEEGIEIPETHAVQWTVV